MDKKGEPKFFIESGPLSKNLNLSSNFKDLGQGACFSNSLQNLVFENNLERSLTTFLVK